LDHVYFVHPSTRNRNHLMQKAKGLEVVRREVGSCVMGTSVGRHSRPICRPTYRPILVRHVGRVSVDISLLHMIREIHKSRTLQFLDLCVTLEFDDVTVQSQRYRDNLGKQI